jgi:hypothetical protein
MHSTYERRARRRFWWKYQVITFPSRELHTEVNKLRQTGLLLDMNRIKPKS